MHIAIIGGGVVGLSAAYDLTRAGHAVTIFDGEKAVGGLAAGFKDEKWEWSLEKFYHHWFFSDQAVLNLIDELGYSDKVYFSSPRTSLWTPERIYPLDSPFLNNGLLGRLVNILRLKPISFFDRLRLGAVSFFVSKYPNGLLLEKHTADTWAARWVGRAGHDLLWRPMLIAKFGKLYDQVNMAWLWARLNKRTAKLGTYTGGFQAFLDDLAAEITNQGGDLRLGNRVQGITPNEAGGFTITFEGGEMQADQVLSTTSPQLMARLAPDLPEAYRNRLQSLVSIGATAMILALDRQLMTDGTYWLNLPAISPDKKQNPFPFLALVEHTNWLSKDFYGGDHLVYLGDYLPPDHEQFRMSDDSLSELYLSSLKLVNPNFSPEWIRKRWVFRAPYAQPVPFVNHSANIPAVRTPLEGLYYASMSQVYPWDRGTNYAVESGRWAAQMMLADAEEKVS